MDVICAPWPHSYSRSSLHIPPLHQSASALTRMGNQVHSHLTIISLLDLTSTPCRKSAQPRTCRRSRQAGDETSTVRGEPGPWSSGRRSFERVMAVLVRDILCCMRIKLCTFICFWCVNMQGYKGHKSVMRLWRLSSWIILKGIIQTVYCDKTLSTSQAHEEVALTACYSFIRWEYTRAHTH